MGRQKKNELDAILEQLKQSYGTVTDDDLEDSLLETEKEESEEDAELASVLEKIFASSTDGPAPKTEEDEPAEIENGEPIDDDEQTIKSESKLIEVDSDADSSESNNDKTDEINDEDVDEDIDEAIDEDIDEDIDDVIDEELDEEMAARFEQFEDEDSKGEDDRAFEEKIEEFLDEMEKGDNSDEEERVDDVLKMMFHKEDKSVNDLQETLTDRRVLSDKDIEELSALPSDPFAEDQCYDDLEISDDEDDMIVDEAADEDGLIIEDEVYDPVADAYAAEIIEDDELSYTVEESDDVLEPEIPAKTLVLDPADYTNDILQHSLREMSLFKPEDDINYSLFDQVDTDEEQQSDSVEEPVRSMPKTEINDSDVSLLLKFGYNGEIASSVGNEYAQAVVVEKNNEYIPPKHKITHGFVGKEFSGNSQIDEIKKKYKSDKTYLLVLGIIASIITISMFACDVMASLAVGSRDYISLIAVELSLTVILAVLLCKKALFGMHCHNKI